MNKYTVKKNKHDFLLWGFLPVVPNIWYKKTSIAWRVDFDNTIKYTLPGADQQDWNKGGGLTFNFFNHLDNSAMWTFRWFNNEIQFGAYAHIDGQVAKAKNQNGSEALFTMAPGDWMFVILDIDYVTKAYSWYFLDKYQTVQAQATVSFNHDKKWSKEITSWFGGNNAAPQNINMWLSNRDETQLLINYNNTLKYARVMNEINNAPNIEIGNKESIELAIFLAEVINGVYRSKQDGKITLLDAANFINAAIAAPNAFNGINQVPAEFKDWTAEEKQQVIAAFASRLKFDGDMSEQEIEDLFQSVLNLAKAIDNLLTKNI